MFQQEGNFREINKDHPIEKPISTGYNFTDFLIKSALKKIHPIVPYAINAYNLGYQGAGYYDNWQRAKEATQHREYNNLQNNEFFLQNK